MDFYCRAVKGGCQYSMKDFLSILFPYYSLNFEMQITSFKEGFCFTYTCICNMNNGLGLGVMVFNATFNNISVILWRSVLLVEETGVLEENHRPVASHIQT